MESETSTQLVRVLLVVFLCILVWTYIKEITILFIIYLILTTLLSRLGGNIYGRYFGQYDLLMGYLDTLQNYLGGHLHRCLSYLFGKDKMVTGVYTATRIEKLNLGPNMTPAQEKSRAIPDTEPSASRRIILLGKTGSGKSSTGNTILGKDDAFREEASFGSVTQKCKRVSGEKFGMTLHVVDTPGLYDTRRTFVQNGKELFNCLSLTKPGPHVFILVVKIGGFSDEDVAAYKHFKVILEDEIFTTGILLFTHADDISATSSLETFINVTAAQNKNFKELCDEFDYRIVALNNKNRADEQQVKQLLDLIDIITNSGKTFINSKSFELKLEILNDIEKDTSLDFSAQMEAFKERMIKAKSLPNKAKDALKYIGFGGVMGLSAVLMKNAPQKICFSIVTSGALYALTKLEAFRSKPKPKKD